jgi:hypothetical protein
MSTDSAAGHAPVRLTVPVDDAHRDRAHDTPASSRLTTGASPTCAKMARITRINAERVP